MGRSYSSSNFFAYKSSYRFRYLNCWHILYSDATGLKLGSSAYVFLLFLFLILTKCQVLNWRVGRSRDLVLRRAYSIQFNSIQDFSPQPRVDEQREYNFLNVFISECINRSFHIQVQNVSVTERPPVHYSLQSEVLQKHLTNRLPPTVVSGQTFLGFPKPLPQFCHLQVPKIKAIINKQMAEDMKIFIASWNPV